MKKSSQLHLINAASLAEIDTWIAKFPPEHRQSAVMAALRIVQDQNGGWLTSELMDAVAEYLHMPAISVYEVATFYSMYELEPVGRHKICVCTNISCMLCDSDGIVDHLQNKLGIKLGETTPDKRFTLKEVECLGACAGAPMLQIGRTYFEHLTPAKVDEILSKLD
jgi:NADH-quinone oxidoreductase subunit E